MYANHLKVCPQHYVNLIMLSKQADLKHKVCHRVLSADRCNAAVCSGALEKLT